MKAFYVQLIFIAGLILTIHVNAQTNDSSAFKQSGEHRFGINQIKDENLHPKVSTGTINQLRYSIEKRRSTWQQLHGMISYSRLKIGYEDLSKSINLELKLDYSYAFPILEKRNFNYFIGPEATLLYDASYFPNWDDSHLYWADYLSVGARNNFSCTFQNKNAWVTSLSIPIFSVFSRPELYRQYKIDDVAFSGIVKSLNSTITAAHITNVFFVDLQTEYQFPVFKSKTEALTYAFDWLRVKQNDGNPFNQTTHQIGIKLYL